MLPQGSLSDSKLYLFKNVLVIDVVLTIRRSLYLFSIALFFSVGEFIYA